MPVLNEENSKKRLHLMLGSKSDKELGKRVMTCLNTHSCWPPLHVLSCHRNPDETRAFALELAQIPGRKAVIGAGGLSYQAPAYLASALFSLGVHVAIFGIPAGDKPEDLLMAYSAMRHLPAPFFIHCVEDNSDACIEEVVGKAVGYVNGTISPADIGESEADWEGRLSLFRISMPIFNVDINSL